MENNLEAPQNIQKISPLSSLSPLCFLFFIYEKQN